MIAVDVSVEKLEAAVDALDANWRRRAADRKAALIAAKKYAEASAIWSDIKPIFIEIQNRKCIFCERQFETPLYGRIEYDLEHFRPKSSVKGWPPRGRVPTHNNYPMGDVSTAGYYWLAYDLFNYAASCK